MNNLFKRLLSFVVALVMVLGMIPVTQFEAKATTNEQTSVNQTQSEPTEQTQNVEQSVAPVGSDAVDYKADLVLDADNKAKCPVCGTMEIWTILTADTVLPTIGDGVHAHYYVDSSVTNNTVNADATYPFFAYVEAGSLCLHLGGAADVLTIGSNIHVGSSGSANIMGGGKLVGTGSVKKWDRRGLVINHHATYGNVNIYSGTLEAANTTYPTVSYAYQATSFAAGKTPGKIYIYKDAVINGKGKAIDMSGGKVEMYGGTINGRVFMQSASYTSNNKTYWMKPDFIMHNGTINGTGTKAAPFSGHGGAVYMSYCSFTMNNGIINGGYVTGNGGAIATCVNTNQKQVYINGGTINGGYAVASATNGVGGGAIYVDGGTGTQKSTLVIGKDAVISGGETAKNGGNIYVTDTTITLNGTVKEGHAVQGGNIYVTGTLPIGGTVKDGYASTSGGNVAATGTSTIEVLAGGLVSGGEGEQNGGSLYGHNVTFKISGTVEGGCSKQGNVGGNIAAMSGSEVYVKNGGIVRNGCAVKAGGNIYNSGRVTAEATETTSAVYDFGKIVIETGGKVYGGTSSVSTGGFGRNIYTDDLVKVEVQTGAEVYQKYEEGAATTCARGDNICIGTCTRTDTFSELKIAGKVYGGKGTGDGANISAGKRVKVTIAEGAEIYGGEAGGKGGNIYVYPEDAVLDMFTMTGGSIYGGSAITDGGNVYFAKNARVIITGGEIYDGEAGGHGGNIFVEDYSATAEAFAMSGGSIYGGASGGNAGNIYIGKKAQANITGGKIYGGTAEGTSDPYSGGGNILVANSAVLDVENAEIYGGISKVSGGNILAHTNSVINLNNGAKVYNGTVNTTGGWPRTGGNITSSSGTINVNTGAAVYGGTSSQNTLGHDITPMYGAVLNLRGGTIGLATNATDYRNIYCYTVADGTVSTVNVYSGTIYGTVHNCRGTFNMYGGTVTGSVASDTGMTAVNIYDGTMGTAYIPHSSIAGTEIKVYHGVFTNQVNEAVLDADSVQLKIGDKYEVHAKVTSVATPHTCTEAGYTTYTCAYDKTVNDVTLTCTDSVVVPGEPAAHTWDEGVQTKAPTCTETGVMTYTCQKDASHTKTEEIAALGHVDADKNHICDRECGEADMGECSDSATDKDHVCDYGCGKVLENCSDVAGDKNHNCDVCGKADVTEHTYSDATCEAPKTCTECANTTGEALGHVDADKNHICDRECGKADMGEHSDSAEDKDHVCDYGCGKVLENCSDVAGDKNHNCDVCGKADVTEHTYSDATCEQAATCTECNVSTGTALGHNQDTVLEAVPATCTATGLTAGAKCSRCGEVQVAQTEVPATGHTAGEAVEENKVDATCTADGSYEEVVYCSVCSVEMSRETKTIEKKAHTEVIDKAVAATCTTTGLTEGKHCSVCGTVTVAQTTVNALGHTEVVDKAVAATCTTTGLTEGKHCSVCEEVLVAQTTVNALGHTAGAAVEENVVGATCTVPGTYDSVVYCSVCNVEISREKITGQVAPHTEVVDQAVAATCTATGLTEGKHCSVCNAVLVAQTEVAALGHDWSAWTTVNDEEHKRTCSRGDAEEVVAHTYEVSSSVIANCIVAASQTEKCTVCGNTKTTHGELDPNNHVSIKPVTGTPASVTAPGVKDHFKCTCGALFMDAEGTKPATQADLVIPQLIVAPVIPNEGVEVEGGEELTETQKQVIEEILTKSEQVKVALDLPENTYLKVTMSSAKVDGEKVTKLTYHVAPMDAEGNKVSTTEKKVTFYLPVPYETTKTVAAVFHEGILLGADYQIVEKNGEKFVVVQSDNFSEFVVDLDYVEPSYVAMIGQTGYKTLEEAIAQAPAGATVTILSDIEFAENAASIVIDKALTIKGENDQITLTFNSATSAFVIQSGDVTFADLIIKQGAKDNSFAISVSKGAWDAPSAQYANITIENIDFIGGDYALCLIGENVVVDGCTFTEQDSHNIIVYSLKGDSKIINNVFNASKGSNKSAVLFEGGADNATDLSGFIGGGKLTISGNEAYNKGVFFQFTSWKLVEDMELYITNNKVDGTTNKAITFYDNDGALIPAGDEFASVVISENVFTNTKAGRPVIREYSGTVDVDASGNYYGSETPDLETLVVGDTVVVENYYAAYENGTLSQLTDTAKDVVEVNGQGYKTLEEAFQKITDGATVTLLADLEIVGETYTIPDGMSIILDMNGKKITATDNKAAKVSYELFYIYGEMTVTGNGTIELTSTSNDTAYAKSSSIFHNRGGVLTIENGTYKHLGGTAMAYVVDNSANSFGDAYLYVNGGEIICENYIAVRMRMEDPNLNGNPGNGQSIAEVTGGYIFGANRGIWGQKSSSANELQGKLTVTGGTIENARADRGAIQIDTDSYAAQNMLVSISGNANIKGALKGGNDEFAVSGGTFTVAVPEEFCAEGYQPKDNGDGTYGVIEHTCSYNEQYFEATFEADAYTVYTCSCGDTYTVTHEGTKKIAVAIVNGEKFETLADAIAAAQNGETVTLLADVALTAGVKIPANKDVTLDLNGKTVSGVNNTNQGNLIYIENTGKLTVKDSAGNGKITYASGSSNVGFAVDVKGDFVLESGTIELTGSWSIGYAVDVRPNSWGTAYTAATTFVMNGGSVISSDGAVRVASSSASAHTNVSAAFTMNGGKIEAAWDGVFIQQSDSVYDVLSFTMNGGTIESDLNPVRVYGPAAADYVNGADCMNIVLNNGTMTYTGTETYTWIIDGVLRTGGGSSIETILESGELTVSAAVAQNSELPEGYEWEENANGTYSVIAHTHAYTGEIDVAPTTTTEGSKVFTCECGDTYTEVLPVLPEAIVTDKGATTYAGSYYIYDVTTSSLTSATGGINLPKTLVFTAQDKGETAENHYYADYNTDFYVKLDGLSAETVRGTGCYLAGYYAAFEMWVVIPLDNVDIQNGLAYPLLAIAGWDFSYEMICNEVEEFTCGLYLSDEFLAANPNVQVTVDLGLREEPADLGNLDNLEYFESEGFEYEKEDLDAELVAEVNGVKYYTLAEAIAAAQNGETVTLLADVALTSTLKIAPGKDVTLDLNGKTVSGVNNTNQGNLIYIENTGKLTVKDSADNGKITYASGSSNVGFAVDVKGEFVLESGTIELTGSWSIGYAVDVRPNSWGTAYTAATTFVMNGGSVISSDGAVRVASSSASAHTNVSAAFTMNGGKIEAAWDGVFIQQSDSVYDVLSFTMNGGTIESDLNPVRVYGPAATDYVNGADCMNIVLNNGTMTYTGTETYTWIIDGVLRAGGGSSIETILESGELTVSAAAAQNFELLEGYKWEENADGNFVAVAKEYVAQIGDKKYETLAEAAKDIATDGSDTTIKLLCDIELNESIEFNYGTGKIIFTADQPVTVKQTKSGLDLAFTVGNPANIVIDKNVTFQIYDNASGMYVYYGPSMTIEGTITGGQNWGCLYLFNGNHVITETGEVSVGRVQVAFNDVTVNGKVDTNYLLVEGATFTADGATIDAGAIHDSNNGGTRWGASQFAFLNGTTVKANSLTMKYADSTVTVDLSSSMEIGKLTGIGKIIIDASAFNGEPVTVISGDLSGFTGKVEIINSKDAVYQITESGLNIVARDPSGKVAYRGYVNNSANRNAVQIDLENVYATESLVIELYDAQGNLLTTTSLKAGAVDAASYTCNIVLWGNPSGSWNTEIVAEKLTVANAPATIKVIADGVVTDVYENALGDKYPEYNALPCIYKAAKVGNTYYVTLAEAIAAANENDTVTLLTDVKLTEMVKIEKAITLDLDDHTITADCRKAIEVYADATITDGTIIANERCVDTRKAVALTLTNVNLEAKKYKGANQQPLTIGGSENGTVLNLNNVTIDAGTQGYAIITFVETEMNAVDSNVSGYMALYVKDGAEGSEFNFENTTLTSNITGNDVAGNATNIITVEADDVAVNVTGGKLVANGQNQTAIALRNVTGVELAIDAEITAPAILNDADVENNSIVVPAQYADALAADGYAYINNGDGTVTAHTHAHVQTGYTDPTFDADGFWTYTCYCGDSYTVTDEGTQKTAVATVNDERYETFAAAIQAAAQNGGVVILLADVNETAPVFAEGVIIDLNGKHLKADIFATIRVNGGIFETSKYVMVAPENAEYISTDAVIEIAVNNFDTTLVSGTVTLGDVNGWTLAGQTLTVGEDAKFIIPTGYNLNVQNTVVVNGEVEVAGTVTLYNADATVQIADENLNVGMRDGIGDKVWYNGTAYVVHTHTEATDAAVAPTCTATGLTEGKHCSVCNDVLVAQTVVDVLPHTEEIIPAVAPTLTETGLTEGLKCSVCGEILKAQEIVETTCVATINGTPYADLFKALEDAYEMGGATVKLEKNLDLDNKRVSLDDKVILDLNGKTLKTTGYVLAIFDASYIIDSSDDNSGRLDVSVNKLRLLDTNEYMPVMLSDGIMFAKVAVNGAWGNVKASNPNGNYQCWIDSADAALIELLKNHAPSELGLKLQVEIRYGGTPLLYTFNEDNFAIYMQNWTTWAMNLGLKGAENVPGITYQVRLVFAEGTEAEVVCWSSSITDHHYAQ